MPTCGWCRSPSQSLILAVRFKQETRFPLATWLALAAVGFMLVRLAGDHRQHGDRRATPERQARRRSTMCRWARGLRCWSWDECEQWSLRRADHLGAIATVRQRGLYQRPLADGRVDPDDGPLSRGRAGSSVDPSQIVRDPGCAARGLVGPSRAAQLPARRVRLSVADRHAPDPAGAGSRAWQPVWAGQGSILLMYRLARTAKHRHQRHAERHRHPADKRSAPAQRWPPSIWLTGGDGMASSLSSLPVSLPTAAPLRSAGTAGC